MDINKENTKYLASLLANCGAAQDEINDLSFNDEVGFFESNQLADWFVNQINFGWRVWQAAKAHEAEKLKGCVLVPVQCPDPDFADSLFDELSKKAIGEFGDDLLIHFSDIDEEKIWALMVEAAKAQAVPEYAEFYLGGGVFAICDWKDYETVKNFKWNTSSRQSRTQWVWAHDPKNADINRRKVAMHNLIMCPPEGLYVDHINGNGLDNRRSNLRIVTKQQNTFNSAHKGGTSKYKGVCLEKESGMWKAYITKDGKKKSIGRFALEDDAARAYDNEAISLFREHAKLNFLPKAMIEPQEPAND